jgi:hypothetical protein
VARDLGVNQSRKTALDEVIQRPENTGEKICKKGLDNSGNIEGICIFVPDFEAPIADEALLEGDFGATNRESARRALA